MLAWVGGPALPRGPGGVRLGVLRDGRYLVFAGHLHLHPGHPPGLQVREEAAGVHLRGERERHGVGGDHGGGHAGRHAVDAGVRGVSLTPTSHRVTHTVRLVEAPVRAQLAGGARYHLRLSGHVMSCESITFLCWIFIIDLHSPASAGEGTTGVYLRR